MNSDELFSCRSLLQPTHAIIVFSELTAPSLPNYLVLLKQPALQEFVSHPQADAQHRQPKSLAVNLENWVWG